MQHWFIRLATTLLFCGASGCADDAESRPEKQVDCRSPGASCTGTQSCIEYGGSFGCYQPCVSVAECAAGHICDGALRFCVPGAEDAGVDMGTCLGRPESCCTFDVDGDRVRGECHLGECTDGANSGPSSRCFVARGNLVFDPQAVVFPAAADGFPRQKSLIISHRGEGPVRITALTFDQFSDCDRVAENLRSADPLPETMAHCRILIDDRPAFPLTLSNQQITTVTVGYLPGEPTPNPATLRIHTTEGEYMVPVSISDDPRFAVNPSGLNIAGERDEQLVIRNAGGGELVVSTMTLSFRGESIEGAPEIVVTPATALPWTLGPEAFERVSVSYVPSDDVPDVADIIFETNDPAQPAVTVTVRTDPGD